LSGNHTVTCEAGEVIESETNYACGVARPDVGHAVDDDLAGGHDERRKHRRTRRLFAALNCSSPSNEEGGGWGKEANRSSLASAEFSNDYVAMT
jgi:hypothetical protein